MQLQERLDELAALDAVVWAISPDDPDRLADLVAKSELSIPMLLDPDLEIAARYGIVADSGKVPHPTAVIVAPDGTITYFRVDEDFSRRPPVDELLDALRSARDRATIQDHDHHVPTLDPAQQAPIDAKLAAFDAEVLAMRAAFLETPAAPRDVEWVAAKLAHMVEVDQLMRHEGMSWSQEATWSDDQKAVFRDRFGSRWDVIDASNTEDLKLLIEIHGWPTISAFGEETESDAWLLAQHADRDPAFQKRVLDILEGLLQSGDTSPKNFAFLHDRVASAENRPQRYGTQGRCVGPGDWDPNPLEDPERIDELRASVGLEPLADYEKLFVDICP